MKRGGDGERESEEYVESEYDKYSVIPDVEVSSDGSAGDRFWTSGEANRTRFMGLGYGWYEPPRGGLQLKVS
ncbi:hypothetical protein CVT25_007901 [Psilocybe cyanescens]|uniref:Uncharacterized protein n=1 Tax=Psilocybe cyanescens TaxID=93625 RepID=A0A409VZA7_PSICY|nr:hypothetical protein CVT25_007901 [Psilocybe cyanescens]